MFAQLKNSTPPSGQLKIANVEGQEEREGEEEISKSRSRSKRTARAQVCVWVMHEQALHCPRYFEALSAGNTRGRSTHVFESAPRLRRLLSSLRACHVCACAGRVAIQSATASFMRPWRRRRPPASAGVVCGQGKGQRRRNPVYRNGWASFQGVFTAENEATATSRARACSHFLQRTN